MLTNIVECDETVRSGLPVEVTFHAAGDVYLPVFRPRIAERHDDPNDDLNDGPLELGTRWERS